MDKNICNICGGDLIQRKDDNEEALNIRLDHYVKDTKPLLDFYQKKNLLHTFDGTVGADELLNELKKLFKEN